MPLVLICWIPARIIFFYARKITTYKGEFMVKKILVLMFLAVSCVVFLPSESKAETLKETTIAAVSGANTSTVALYQRRWRRWNNRRYNRNMNRRNRRLRVIRQVYYRNGRRYVRMIRVY
jgi:hypothetical protein